jgi:phosphatidylserine/phosphatidylglycerophosphate/cardiolipin synthase-like enzyme
MSTRRLGILAILLVGVILAACAGVLAIPPTSQIAVYFSPHGGCTDAVVKKLDAAKESVLVQAYTFTSAPIAKALMDAHKRGVKVRVICDKSQWTEKYSSATFFQNAGIPTFIDDKHAIAHNKVMVIDGRIVITGSFNFTKAAEESNAENLLIIDDAQLAQKYARNWQEHLEHSVPYERPAKEQEMPLQRR